MFTGEIISGYELPYGVLRLSGQIFYCHDLPNIYSMGEFGLSSPRKPSHYGIQILVDWIALLYFLYLFVFYEPEVLGLNWSLNHRFPLVCCDLPLT